MHFTSARLHRRHTVTFWRQIRDNSLIFLFNSQIEALNCEFTALKYKNTLVGMWNNRNYTFFFSLEAESVEQCTHVYSFKVF